MEKPRSITYRRASRTLVVEFDDARYEIPAELLRVYSPSAEVRGHGDDERKLETGKKYVGISGIEPVGNYAIRITFDDGHDTGIFAWGFLAEVGNNAEQMWRDYEARLQAANASRLPTIAVGQWSPDR